MSIVDRLLEELRGRRDKARELGGLLAGETAGAVVEELLRSRRLRRELLLAVAKETATREDLEKLGERLEGRIEELRAGMSRVEERIERLGREWIASWSGWYGYS